MIILLVFCVVVSAHESFNEALPKLTNWTRLLDASLMERVDLEETFLQNVVPYLLAEPLEPVNAECKPPPLETVTSELCTQEPNAGFTRLRERPVKVAQHFYFGYDIDIIEVQIRENFD